MPHLARHHTTIVSTLSFVLWVPSPSVLTEKWPLALGQGVVLVAEAALVVEEEEVPGSTLVSTTFRCNECFLLDFASVLI